jgi:phosphinothricin acetyltransferase
MNRAEALPGVTVRNGKPDDLPALTDIYNHYILQSPATFDIEAFTVEARQSWLDQFAAVGPYRLLVAENRGEIAGFACTSRFRPKAAYDVTVETTVYCAPGQTGRGIGRALYGQLFDSIRTEDLTTAVACITLPNEASVALHERFGFTLAGVLHGIGRKFGRDWDVAWYEKRL